MKKYFEVVKLFSDRIFVWDVLRFSTLLEFELNGVLTQYFIRSDRYESAMEFLLPELSFGRKIDLLTRISIRKSLLSYQRAVTGLRKFQKIRNIVAHSPILSTSKAKSLSKDGNYKRIIHEYPEGMQEEWWLTSRSLLRLLRVREFKNQQSDEVINLMMIRIKD